MNALVSIETILSPELIAPPYEALTPAIVFAPGGVEHIISRVEAEVLAEVFTLDTAEGRERIKSVAYKVARSKTALDEMGKELVAGIKAQAGAIDADRRTIRDRLDALKERVRGPLTAWEAAEADRVAAHEDALVVILKAPADCQMLDVTSEGISRIKSGLEELAGRNWQEFGDRAAAAFAETMPKLVALRDAAEQRERDAAELAELRRLKAEREEADRKAEAERIAAQQAAERKAYEERREKERAEQQAERERQQAARAEQQKAEAVAAAIEQERRRQEAEAYRATQKKAAEEAAERKRQENKRHRTKVRAEIRAGLIELLGPVEQERQRIEEAELLIDAIAAGKIPHVRVEY